MLYGVDTCQNTFRSIYIFIYIYIYTIVSQLKADICWDKESMIVIILKILHIRHKLFLTFNFLKLFIFTCNLLLNFFEQIILNCTESKGQIVL